MKPPKMTKIPSEKKVKSEMAIEEKTGKRTIDPRPEFEVNAEEFPDIKDWKTGQKYMVMMEVEQVGSHIGEWGDDKGKLCARFKVNGIASHNEDYEGDEKKEEEINFPKGMKK